MFALTLDVCSARVNPIICIISIVRYPKFVYPWDPNAEQAAILHIEFDRMCSADPKYKKFLKKLAENATKQRKKIQKFSRNLKKEIERNEIAHRKRAKASEKKLKAELDKIVNLWKKPRKKK